MNRSDHPDPDDMFADTRMTFGEHIEDLRTHLIRAIYGFILGMVIALFFAKGILGVITAPVDRELDRFEARYAANRKREMIANPQILKDIPPIFVPEVWIQRDGRQADQRAVLPGMVPSIAGWMRDLGFAFDPRQFKGENWEKVGMFMPNPLEWAEQVGELQRILKPRRLTTLSIQEGFVVFFKVAIMAGFVIASPIVFWQLWSFVAAGLYPTEKRLVHVYLPFSLGLFIAGVLVCQFVVIPKAVAALLWFNEWLGFQPDLRLNEWLGFAIFMPVVFGLSFQTPLVMLFLYLVGLFDIDTYKEKRRMAFFLMAVFAAVITPSTDAFSMMFMWVPMCFLYEVGIWLCMFKRREETEYWEADEPHELVEV
jgi:sec-independent protein translocase protein TatC